VPSWKCRNPENETPIQKNPGCKGGQMNKTHSAEPLARFRWFRTSDFDEARAQVARQFRDHKLDSIGRLRRLDTIQNSVRLAAISLHYLDYGGAVRVQADALDSFYLVVMPLGGSGRLRYGGVQIVFDERNAAILSASRNFRIEWQADCRTLIARIERGAMDARLAGYIGAPPRYPIEFRPQLRADSACGRLFTDTIAATVRRLDAGDALPSNPILCRELEQSLIGMLLQGHDHNYARIVAARPGRAPPRSAIMAAEFIGAHADRPICLEDLSRIAGVTGRALQHSFARCYGMSPMDFLRRIRLGKVREELTQAAPDSGATVTAVALKWGFSHLGRFSGLYRGEFGESPSATLRR
jgi:AraC-like DNA-binding protein